MTNFANLNMEINDEVVKKVFEQSLNQAIVTAMGNKEDYMAALVNSAFSQKVDKTGKVSSYDRENRHEWLDIFVKKAIQEAGEEAILEYLDENKKTLKEQVKREMEKPENKSALVNAFVEAAQNAFNFSYNFSAKVELKRFEED